MRTSNETRLNSTGGPAAGLAAVRTLPVSDRVKQAAACAYEFDHSTIPLGGIGREPSSGFGLP